MDKTYLTEYDEDCFTLSLDELARKYPKLTRERLAEDKAVIEKVCCELSEERFKRWIAARKHLIYRF